eukprot:Opistho-2@73323
MRNNASVDERSSFLQEAEIMIGLSHPNVSAGATTCNHVIVSHVLSVLSICSEWRKMTQMHKHNMLAQNTTQHTIACNIVHVMQGQIQLPHCVPGDTHTLNHPLSLTT